MNRSARGRFGLSVTPRGQTVWLDEPGRVFTPGDGALGPGVGDTPPSGPGP
ncbi:hypothetical protein [Nocardiopsis dassonvillei]|uniref:hypothetical protein n=1 Tax=Nocardiopsis dassonvillei TaxID=2014 RepID=UPI0036340598